MCIYLHEALTVMSGTFLRKFKLIYNKTVNNTQVSAEVITNNNFTRVRNCDFV